MIENLLKDTPSPLELHVQTSRIYANIAASEYALGHFASAHNAHSTSEKAYRKALELLSILSDTETQYRLEKIRVAILQNQRNLGL